MAQNAIDIKAAAASMLARCIAGDDAEKFFGAVDTLFNGEIRKGAMSFEELDAKLKWLLKNWLATCQRPDPTLAAAIR